MPIVFNHMFRCFALTLAISLLGPFTVLSAQLPSIDIQVYAGAYPRANSPVSIAVADLAESFTRGFQLIETSNGLEKPVFAQLEGGSAPKLHWILEGETPAETSRSFKLTFSDKKAEQESSVFTEDTGEKVVFNVDGKEVLTYHYGLTPVPEGVSERYRRGGYIHPLRAPNGGSLTRIQPPDHYHHYGIWNPWTKTEFGGEELDFWNLNQGQGTIRVKNVPLVAEGEVFGELTAYHEHVVLDTINHENDKVALNEAWNIRVWNSHSWNSARQAFMIDFASTLNPATDQPFTIKEYRYQGFGFRANEHWNDESARLVTSEGYDKSDGNGTRARWCYVNGPTDQGEGGVLFMTYPTNYNYPEQIRIWPTGMNDGKENVFFNFNPAMDRDWKLQPKENYTLKYRMVTYNEEMDSETAERYWQDFVHPPAVEVKTIPGLEDKKILLYTKNQEGEGYFVHENIPYSIKAIQKLADENDFEVVASEDPGQFTTENLKQYDALIFSNTNNDIFDTPEQEEAFKGYIESGGRFVAIHSACGSERDWPWFWKNLGGKFWRHAPRQDFDVKVIDKTHPSTQFLPETWSIDDDECYYLNHLNPEIHVLVVSDLTTVEDEKKSEYPGDIFGDTFPTTWCHTTDGGRQWYTSLGHRPEHYSDPTFMKHILGGIIWVLSDEAP